MKFARNKASQIDQDILRSEYCFYRAVQQLGMDTVAAEGLALEEGNKPSLWMHRFDREISSTGVCRTAVESMYSLCGVTEAGSYMLHTQVLGKLVELWRAVGQEQQVGDLVFEYMRRDLLNQILGNSDNHGRNTAILRSEQGFGWRQSTTWLLWSWTRRVLRVRRSGQSTSSLLERLTGKGPVMRSRGGLMPMSCTSDCGWQLRTSSRYLTC